MPGLRKVFYKIDLKLSDGRALPITLATVDINRVQSLVERKKILYNTKTYHVTGFSITETVYPLQWPEDKYEDELAWCDIVDEEY